MGESCWDPCGHKGGLCDWCGSGACCREDGFDSKEPECKNAKGYKTGGHECVQVEDAASAFAAPATPCCEFVFCEIWGDPHIVSFDGFENTLRGSRVYWAVKTSEVQIQGLSNGQVGWSKGLAAGGPWLGGHKLVVLQKTGGKHDPLTFYWDGKEVAGEDKQGFVYKELVDIKKSDSPPEHLQLLPKGTRKLARDGWRKGSHWHVKLPNNVILTLQTWDTLVALIRMPKSDSGATGMCGNMNGNKEDDKGLHERQQAVPNKDSFFGDVALDSLGLAPGLAEVDGSVEAKGCTPERRALAAKACAGIERPIYKKACIYDVCTTGDADAALDSVGAVVEEMEDAPAELDRFFRSQ